MVLGLFGKVSGWSKNFELYPFGHVMELVLFKNSWSKFPLTAQNTSPYNDWFEPFLGRLVAGPSIPFKFSFII